MPAASPTPEQDERVRGEIEGRLRSALEGVVAGSVPLRQAAAHIATARSRGAAEWCSEVEAVLRRTLVAPPKSAAADVVVNTLALACALGEASDSEPEGTGAVPGPVAGLLRYALKFLPAKDKGVRIRAARTVAAVLAAAPADTELDEDDWETARDALIEATGDKVAGARAAACQALQRLQDSSPDADCPAHVQLRRLAAHDASREVRKAAVAAMAVTHDTLPALLARTGDVDAVVRAAALAVLADAVSPDALSPTQRASVVRRAAADESKAVREAGRALVCRWFWACGGGGPSAEQLEDLPAEDRTAAKEAAARAAIASCVGLLDLEQDVDAAQTACRLLFAFAARARPRDAADATAPAAALSAAATDAASGRGLAATGPTPASGKPRPSEVWAALRLAVGSGEPPSPSSLTPASALVWRVRCDWLRQRSTKRGNAGAAALAELETLVPPLSAVSAVIASRAIAESGAAKHTAKAAASCRAGEGDEGDDDDDEEEAGGPLAFTDEAEQPEGDDGGDAGMGWADAFVVRQLLALARDADMGEEVGRRRLADACTALWALPAADDLLVTEAALTHAAACGADGLADHVRALAEAAAELVADVPLPLIGTAELEAAAAAAATTAEDGSTVDAAVDPSAGLEADGEEDWRRALLLARLTVQAASARPGDAAAALEVQGAVESLTSGLVSPALSAATGLIAAACGAGAALLTVAGAEQEEGIASQGGVLAPGVAPAALGALSAVALLARRGASAALPQLAAVMNAVPAILVAAASGQVASAVTVGALSAAAAAAHAAGDAILLWQHPARQPLAGAEDASLALARLAAGRALAGSAVLGPEFAEPAATAAAAEPALQAAAAAALATARVAAGRALCRVLACRRLAPMRRTCVAACSAAAFALYCGSDATGVEAASLAVEMAGEELAEAALAAGADEADVDAPLIVAEMMTETGAAAAIEGDERLRQELTVALPAVAGAGSGARASLVEGAIAAARGLADAARWAAVFAAVQSGSTGKRARQVAAADAEVVEGVLALAGFLAVSGVQDDDSSASASAGEEAAAAAAEARAQAARDAQAVEGSRLHADMAFAALADVAAEPKGPFASIFAKAAASLDCSMLGARGASAGPWLVEAAVEGGALKGTTKSLNAALAAAGLEDRDAAGDGAEAAGEAVAARIRDADAVVALAERIAEGECGRSAVGTPPDLASALAHGRLQPFAAPVPTLDESDAGVAASSPAASIGAPSPSSSTASGGSLAPADGGRTIARVQEQGNSPAASAAAASPGAAAAAGDGAPGGENKPGSAAKQARPAGRAARAVRSPLAEASAQS
ncbi:hypothetical protein FNF31_05958 [Cafeteria roenbergensis]|uniref:Nuclear condensin complex subunit 3 C-terminal domain-containing protein n=1 Tax=Cafeteria roenbergensis TaxID=33653 RepID=A0A5A8CSU3_CAFRO|nr:hypothetical protein FNF31_05958 [Cafeteria roenbergensis]